MWIRMDRKTLVMQIAGKLSETEQATFRRKHQVKGEYRFIFSPRTGRTTVKVIEHPEWA